MCVCVGGGGYIVCVCVCVFKRHAYSRPVYLCVCVQELIAAVQLLGTHNWGRIHELVPGRTREQCRERYSSTLSVHFTLLAIHVNRLWVRQGREMCSFGHIYLTVPLPACVCTWSLNSIGFQTLLCSCVLSPPSPPSHPTPLRLPLPHPLPLSVPLSCFLSLIVRCVCFCVYNVIHVFVKHKMHDNIKTETFIKSVFLCVCVHEFVCVCLCVCVSVCVCA